MPRREGDGLKFLYICILSTSSTEQATLFPLRYPARPGALHRVLLQVGRLPHQRRSPAPAGPAWPPRQPPRPQTLWAEAGLSALLCLQL